MEFRIEDDEPDALQVMELIAAWWDARVDRDVDPLERGPDQDAALDLYAEVEEGLRSRKVLPGPLDADVVAFLNQRLASSELWRVRAVGYAYDATMWPLVNREWVKRHAGSVLELVPGNFFPVPEWPQPAREDLCARPSTLRRDQNDFPHFRLCRPAAGGFTFTFDFRMLSDLEGAMASPCRQGTVHPNTDESQLDLGPDDYGFPIAPANPEHQTGIVGRGASGLIEKHATLIVIPELAVNAQMVRTLQEIVDSADRPTLVVAGSVHQVDGVEKVNEASILVREGTPGEFRQRKMVPFRSLGTGSRPTLVERIDPGPRTISVFASNSWRFSVLICRDFLEAGLIAALSEVGVNVVAVPAMSEDMAVFERKAGTFASDTQGVAVVANNPARILGSDVRPVAVYGQPIEGAIGIAWPADTSEFVVPAYTWRDIGGAVGWSSLVEPGPTN